VVSTAAGERRDDDHTDDQTGRAAHTAA
jgi:hypothetical protein